MVGRCLLWGGGGKGAVWTLRHPGGRSPLGGCAALPVGSTPPLFVLYLSHPRDRGGCA